MPDTSETDALTERELRQIAWERLVDLHERHVLTQKRSVTREAFLKNPGEFASS